MLGELIKRIPGARRLWARIAGEPGADVPFEASGEYWERRYARGGTSGAGSYGRLATFKAGILNDFVRRNAIRDVIEFGCGDGAQLQLAEYPAYIGVDVSETALQLCRARFATDPTKRFCTPAELPALARGPADLTLSLDVVYHLVEDEVFERYMASLFDHASRYVAVYSSDHDDHYAPHVRHRRFSGWVAQNRPEWVLAERIPNAFPFDKDDGTSSWADFFIYERRQTVDRGAS